MQVTALYATFSPVSLLPAAERRDLLARLAKIVDERFGGRIERPMATTLYVARRSAVPLPSD